MIVIEETLITGEKSKKAFRLGERIRHGVYGVVYTAEREGNKFAIKLPLTLDSQEHGDFLIRGAHYQEAFSHPDITPHITPVILYDRTKDLVPGIEVPFLVMPLAEGNLRMAMATSHTINEAMTIGEHTASALAAIHAHGLLHNDLKLDNVLYRRTVEDRREWELTDFGHAKTIEAIASNPSVIYDFEDPPDDQVEPLSPSSEQYAWAANLIYPAVTGRAGIHVATLPEIPSFQNLLRSQRMTILHELEVLEEVVTRAIKENPSERYPSMEDLHHDLQEKHAKAKEMLARQRNIIT